MNLLINNRILAVGITLVLVTGLIAYFSTSGKQGEEGGVPDIVDFNYHVRPILSDKCFKCHGPDANKREANLRLDTEEGAYAALKEDPSQHVVVPGDPLNSTLYMRLITSDTAEVMPPPSAKLPPLSKTEIEILKKWIAQGAKYKPHWSFIAPTRHQVPKVDTDIEPINPIDNFIFAMLEEKGLEPSEQADKETLLKRVSMDITGLAPSIELQDRFLNDDSPNAYEKIVDELLASKHYGEKMAAHWLDIARYADSHGYQDDSYRTMWPWRDWVIHAFNQNYPFSKFITWQLAGDLLPNPTKEQILATGFNRNHKITQEGGVIDEEYRIEYVTDRTNTYGKAFMAMTLECSKCHDHKYDPISQKEYFSMFAFFDRVPEKGIVGTIDASHADPPTVQITSKDVDSLLTFINKKDTSAVKVMVMQDSSDIRKTRVLRRGAYDQPSDTVDMGTPNAILAFNTNKYEKNRLGLVKWMLAPENPLTSRVFVNRIWNEFFGRGLVKTVGDFGMQGELPSHPELLDWLSVEFREGGWDIKKLVKMIVTSATYKQTTKRSQKVYQIDPDNKYYSYYPRLRLSAELQRDLVLSSTGLLNPEIGGPSVKPYQPKGVWEATTSGRGELARYVQDKGDKLYRRGLYTFIKRTAPPPALLIMDASTRDQCEVTRTRTNTPLQALVLMNDPQTLEAARVLAQKTANLNLSEEQKIERSFRTVLCRKPKATEVKMLTEYYQQEKNKFNQDKKRAISYLAAGEFEQIKTKDVAETAALMQVNQMLFNIDETTIK